MSHAAQVRIVFVLAIAALFFSNAIAQIEGSAVCSQPEIQPTAPDVTSHYYRPSCGVTPPKVLENPDPVWPDLSLRIKHGTALLWIGIGEDGTVRDMEVLKASRIEFAESAVEAIRRWKFTPGMKDGQPVPVAVQVTTKFDR